MLTPDGLKLVEYNVRFGDPEAQVECCQRMSSDLVDLLVAAADGALSDRTPTFIDDAAVCVVGAAPGFIPGSSAGA